MSHVTFTPEQIAEIRRRIITTQPGTYEVPREAVLSRFPLPKVTRYRTFTMTWGDLPDSTVETYRVNDSKVEYLSQFGDHWHTTTYGDGTAASFAEQLVAKERWTALAAFADVCARPVEEVDA